MEKICEVCKKPIVGNSHTKIDGLFRKDYCDFCYKKSEKEREKREKKVA
jgi:hypothetical protein